MRMSLKRQALDLVNRVIQPFQIEVVPSLRPDRPVDQYIPFKKTISEAKKAGMTVSQFIENTYAGSGTVLETIQRLEAGGAIHPGQSRICEIGPGSGRYLERILRVCRPAYYEIYETAEEWRSYLTTPYPVAAQPCDGRTMAGTPDESIDLVHAHRVFMTIPLTVTLGYLFETIRVTRKGGRVVFDILSAECLDEPTARKWAASGALYPQFLEKPYVVDLFARKAFRLLDSFFIGLQHGRTEYLVFEKCA